MSTAAPRRSPDQRREQVLRAAEEILVERGLRATTMSAVAERAGVAKGTTYLYFASKDDLLAAVRSRYLDRFIAAMATDVDAPAGERLEAVVGGLFEVAAAHQALHHVLFHEAGFSEADAFTPVRTLLDDILTTGAATGRLAVDDTAVASSFLLHGIHGALVDGLHADRPPAGDAVARLVRRAVGC